MEQQKLYSPPPNEDVTIINLRSKLLVLENIYTNQKMMNSCVFTHHGNQVQAIRRSMADMVSLSEALAPVGLRVLGFHGAPMSTQNVKLTGLIKTDLVFKLFNVYKSPTLPHTNLQDSSPIVFQVSK